MWWSPLRGFPPPGRQVGVQISVQDNDLYPPTPIKRKNLPPIFYHQADGQRTGLDFSLSYDIVKAQCGELLVESKGGEIGVLEFCPALKFGPIWTLNRKGQASSILTKETTP